MSPGSIPSSQIPHLNHFDSHETVSLKLQILKNSEKSVKFPQIFE